MPKRVDELSLAQLGKLTQGYAAQISAAEHSLRIVSAPFKEKGTILPIQCRKAISTINETNERVQEFCELLNNTSSQPAVFTALRYKLLYVLHLVEDQGSELVGLIDSFCDTCMAPSQYLERREIYESFKTLFQHVSVVAEQTASLDEAAQRQEDYLTLFITE